MQSLIGSYLTTLTGRVSPLFPYGRCNAASPSSQTFLWSPATAACPPWLLLPLRFCLFQACVIALTAVSHGSADSWFSRLPARGHAQHHRGPIRTPACSVSRHQGPERCVRLHDLQPRLRLRQGLYQAPVRPTLLQPRPCPSLPYFQCASWLHATRQPGHVILSRVANYSFLLVYCTPINPLSPDMSASASPPPSSLRITQTLPPHIHLCSQRLRDETQRADGDE
jgi:hypothetical protein